MSYLRRGYADSAPAIDQRITENLDLVRRIAWHFHARVGKRIEIDDLLQVGYLGLIDASRRYTPQPGVSFSAYARIRIRGAIVDHLRSVSNICRSTLRLGRRIDETVQQLQQKLHRPPSEAETAAALGISVADLAQQRAELSASQPASLDEVYADHLLAFRDQADSAEDKMVKKQLRDLLARAVAELSNREQMVLQLYYVEELNVYEVAEILGVTTGRVSQIKKAAVQHLRQIMDRMQAAD